MPFLQPQPGLCIVTLYKKKSAMALVSCQETHCHYAPRDEPWADSYGQKNMWTMLGIKLRNDSYDVKKEMNKTMEKYLTDSCKCVKKLEKKQD